MIRQLVRKGNSTCLPGYSPEKRLYGIVIPMDYHNLIELLCSRVGRASKSIINAPEPHRDEFGRVLIVGI